MEIMLATMADFQGVKDLLKANHISSIPEELKKDGFVTTNLTDEQLERLILDEGGVTIAKDAGRVVSFALAAPWEYWAQWPLFQHMIEILPSYFFDGKPLSVETSYQYGPVCIDKDYRGRGIFEQVFFASLASMADRYPVMATFVNQINPRSYAAHTRKAGMETSGTFSFNGNQYYLLSCSTKSRL